MECKCVVSTYHSTLTIFAFSQPLAVGPSGRSGGKSADLIVSNNIQRELREQKKSRSGW